MRYTLLSLAVIGLAGCASGSHRGGDQPTSPHFGSAVRANIAAQVAAAAAGGEITDGARAALAVRKYQNNTVQVLSAPTASGVGGSASAN